MNDFTFTPDQTAVELKVPYIEEARADFAPYYGSDKSIERAKDELRAQLAKLGATILLIQEGTYNSGKQKRYGYQISYVYHGRGGIIKVAGLPIKHTHTATKINQVRRQALLIAVDWWRAVVTQQVFSPGTDPLLMNLLVDKDTTVAEHIRRTGNLPALPGNTDGLLEDKFG